MTWIGRRSIFRIGGIRPSARMHATGGRIAFCSLLVTTKKTTENTFRAKIVVYESWSLRATTTRFSMAGRAEITLETDMRAGISIPTFICTSQSFGWILKIRSGSSFSNPEHDRSLYLVSILVRNVPDRSKANNIS